jgi:hypothetical protein
VHAAQIKIGFPVWVLFPEKISRYFTKIKQSHLFRLYVVRFKFYVQNLLFYFAVLALVGVITNSYLIVVGDNTNNGGDGGGQLPTPT